MSQQVSTDLTKGEQKVIRHVLKNGSDLAKDVLRKRIKIHCDLTRKAEKN